MNLDKPLLRSIDPRRRPRRVAQRGRSCGHDAAEAHPPGNRGIHHRYHHRADGTGRRRQPGGDRPASSCASGGPPRMRRGSAAPAIARSYAGDAPDPWSQWSPSTELTYVTSRLRRPARWRQLPRRRVRRAGQGLRAQHHPAIRQERSDGVPGGRLVVRTSADLAGTYTGAWGTSTCTCWSGREGPEPLRRGARELRLRLRRAGRRRHGEGL